MKLRTALIILIAIDAAVIGLVFSVSGVFDTSVDTADYVAQIGRYDALGVSAFSGQPSLRDFKPLYGIIGSTLTPMLSPESAILALNILFLFGLSVAAFFFARSLSFPDEYALLGAVWVSTGYPLLKYGLALGTDMSGWFFALLAAALGLRGLQKDSLPLLAAASIVGFIGSLAKETGVLGLAAVGFSFLFTVSQFAFRRTVERALAIGLPFILAELAFLAYLISSGVPTFFDWYSINREGIHSYQTLGYFVGVEASTFNALLLLSGLGIFMAWKTRDLVSYRWLALYVPLLAASLPMVVWPMYISRIMYAGFLLVIPLSLYGLRKFNESRGRTLRDPLSLALSTLPIAASVGLFLLAGGGSLFSLAASIL